MNARSIPVRGALVALLALAAVLGPAARADAAPLHPEIRKLHVLIVIDTYDSGAKRLGMLLDQDNMMALLRRTIPAERLSITNLEGRAVTRSNILGYYERLEVGPDEGLLFYYSG